jgi:hypothetical protein
MMEGVNLNDICSTCVNVTKYPPVQLLHANNTLKNKKPHKQCSLAIKHLNSEKAVASLG